MSTKPFDTRKNYTKFHNYVLDTIMPELKPTTWKVLCFIIRKTEGWGKQAEQLSYNQIKKGTGIGSYTTLSRAIKELADADYILVEVGDSETSNTYQLNTEWEVPTTVSVVGGTPKSVGGGTTISVDTKRNSFKESTSSRKLEGTHPTPSPHQQMFEKICDIVGWDYKTLDKGSKGQVAQTLGILKESGYTLEDLNRFGKEVWIKDWRWEKLHQRPTIKQLRQEIGKLKANDLEDEEETTVIVNWFSQPESANIYPS